MRPIRAAVWLAIGFASIGAHSAETPVDDVKAEFAAICERARVDLGLDYGRHRLSELRALADTPIAEPEERLRIQKDLAHELLKQGEAEEAKLVLSAALAFARSSDLEQNAVWELRSDLATYHLREAIFGMYEVFDTERSTVLSLDRMGANSRNARIAGNLELELLQTVEGSGMAIRVAWLLNLARLVSDDWPSGVPEPYLLPRERFESESPLPVWRDRAAELGVNELDLAGGAVMDDFDGDGLLDLISSSWDPCKSLTAFRNDGRGGFENVTQAWGLDDQLGGLNLEHADYDNDGRPDLLVLRGAWFKDEGLMRESLLRNEIGSPAGRFVDVTRSAGLGDQTYPTQTAGFQDYDGDGDLDLYIGNETNETEAFPSRLYRNDGDGTFTDVAVAAGVVNYRFSKSVAWGDYDDDGDPDLYVSNFGPNRLYRNQGDGTFVDVAPQLGVTEPSGRSFLTWFFDYDNDSDLDLFVVDFGAMASEIWLTYFGADIPKAHPVLYRNDGGRFTDVSREVGFDRPVMPMGANFGDLDNDGYFDFYLGTGNPKYESLMPNVMYRNVEGRRFADVTFSGGFGHLQKGHGVAFGDLDNDGDQDLFHQLGGFYPGDVFYNALFENPGNENAWITLRLEGVQANRQGLGARIEVRVAQATGFRSVHVVAGSGASFGGSSLQQEIGLGRTDKIDEIIVRWPGSGTVQRFEDVQPNRVYRVIEGQDELVPVKTLRITLGSSTED